MAFWLSKSRSISSLLGKRIGLLTILHERKNGSFLQSRRDGVFGYKNSPEFSIKSATFSATGRRFKSSKTGEQVELPSSDEDDDENHAVDFPGGRVAFTSRMNFTSESSGKRIPCFRVLDDNGYPIAGSIFEQVNKEVAVRMYSGMVTLQIMDTILYETQRQGRISFYLTSTGEEAINLASAAALSPDDVVLPQYREPGVLLWRGFTLQEFANQCFGNEADYGKGRQMPIHYGSQKHNYFTVSSPIATQLPQAAGVAYSLKMDKKNACVVTYMGDGGTSDGVVVRGQAYGIRSIRVDGNDALAVYNSVRTARQTAINEQRPILIEALTYRVGHHSTSDDSTKYRALDEIEHWKTAQNPVARFRKWVQGNGWWTDENESEFRSNIRKQLMEAIQLAARKEKPPIANLFTDVYEENPPNLVEQERSLGETIKKHPQDYPSDVPL